jgi:putative flippase GtrA
MSRTEMARRIGRGTLKSSNWVQLFQFGLVGASGYLVNLTVFGLLAEVLEIHHIPAAVGAFCVAVSNNFYWNRHWTFDAAHGHAGFQAARFFTVSVGGLIVNLIALQLLIEGGLSELPAQALAVAIAMPFNFIGNKIWTFDDPRTRQPTAEETGAGRPG